MYSDWEYVDFATMFDIINVYCLCGDGSFCGLLEENQRVTHAFRPEAQKDLLSHKTLLNKGLFVRLCRQPCLCEPTPRM